MAILSIALVSAHAQKEIRLEINPFLTEGKMILLTEGKPIKATREQIILLFNEKDLSGQPHADSLMVMKQWDAHHPKKKVFLGYSLFVRQTNGSWLLKKDLLPPETETAKL